jgi:WD40 repeat protein
MRRLTTALLVGLSLVCLSTFALSQSATDSRKVTLRTQVGHAGSISATAFSSDGRVLLSAAADGQLKVWETTNGRLVRTISMEGGKARSVALLPNQKYAVAATDDGTLEFYDITDGRFLGHLPPGHQGWIYSAVILPDGHRIVSGSGDGTIKLWDIDRKPQEVRTIQTGTAVSSVSVSSDGSFVLSGDDEGRIRVWSLVDGT